MGVCFFGLTMRAASHDSNSAELADLGALATASAPSFVYAGQQNADLFRARYGRGDEQMRIWGLYIAVQQQHPAAI